MTPPLSFKGKLTAAPAAIVANTRLIADFARLVLENIPAPPSALQLWPAGATGRIGPARAVEFRD